MLCEAVPSSGMAPRKVEQRKEAVSVTLTAANLKALREIGGRMEIEPSLSQLIDRAIAAYVSASNAPAKKSDRK